MLQISKSYLILLSNSVVSHKPIQDEPTTHDSNIAESLFLILIKLTFNISRTVTSTYSYPILHVSWLLEVTSISPSNFSNYLPLGNRKLCQYLQREIFSSINTWKIWKTKFCFVKQQCDAVYPLKDKYLKNIL